LTDEGRSALERGKVVANSIVAKTMDSVNAGDLVAMDRVLNIMKKNLNEIKKE
jgi:hypothetical protein